MSRSHAARFAVANRVARRAMVALVLGLALLAGCGGSGGSDEPSPAAGPATSTTADTTSTTQAPSTASSTSLPPATVPTTAAPDSEAEVKAAYLEIMDEFYRRLEHPDPTDPTVSQNHTGPSLEQVKDRLADLVRDGAADVFTSRGVPRPQVVGIEVQGDEAMVRNCIVDDVIVRRIKTGEILNNRVDSVLIESALVRMGSRWQLKDQVAVRSWPDANGCSR